MDEALNMENVEENHSEVVEDMGTRDSKQVSEAQPTKYLRPPAEVGPVAEKQSTAGPSSEVLTETNTEHHPTEESHNEVPLSSHGNMSYEQFERAQK